MVGTLALAHPTTTTPGRVNARSSFLVRAALDLLGDRGPVGRGAQALHEVEEARVAADQDPGLVLLDAFDDAERGAIRRLRRDFLEALDCLIATRIRVGHAAARARIARDVGGYAPGMHHRHPHRAVLLFK